MTYFKIGDNDYSIYVNALNVNNVNNYSSLTNAAGDTIVDYINTKRVIEVGVIPLTAAAMSALLADLASFNVAISFLNPVTKELEENVNCIIPEANVSYYTIQADKVLFNAFSLTFEEL